MKAVALSLVVAVLVLFAVPPAHTQRTPSVSLKEVFKSDFLIGAALNRRQFFEEDQRSSHSSIPSHRKINSSGCLFTLSPTSTTGKAAIIMLPSVRNME
jgi:hypothetical protein